MESTIINFYRDHIDAMLVLSGLISLVILFCFFILVDDVHAIRHYLKNLEKSKQAKLGLDK